MRIEELSITTLQLVGLALPYLLFVVHNSFRRWWWITLRAVVATCAGWMFWLAFAFSADALNRAAATTEKQIEELNDGDGAKFVFALIFGWVVPAITVTLAWAFRSWLLPRLKAMGSNIFWSRRGET